MSFFNSPGKLYHLSLATSSEQVMEHGLLSTSALLNRFAIYGQRRNVLERTRRAKREPITHPDYGTVYLNDQFPLFEGGLKKCLVDMSIEEWCLSLNRRVFFWAEEANLNSLVQAQKKKGYGGMLLSVQRKALHDAFGDQIELSPINSGNATRKAAMRGSAIFASVSAYPHSRVVEVTVPYEMKRTDLLTVQMIIPGGVLIHVDTCRWFGRV